MFYNQKNSFFNKNLCRLMAFAVSPRRGEARFHNGREGRRAAGVRVPSGN